MGQNPRYFIKGDLSEKQIEADVASYMGWCTPVEVPTPFRLLDIDEQKTGADKLFDQGSLIYMQFKKSAGLRPVTTVGPSKRKGRSKLEDIREFRASMELDDDPSLFFQLRAKAKTATDFQHNVLLSYERPPYSRGIYVAPLILDKFLYHKTLHNSTDRFLLHPFYHRLETPVHSVHWVRSLSYVPFLREHISIAPHERVTTHDHYYAFSQSGTDISWHSPTVLKQYPSRLSDFIVSTLTQTYMSLDGSRDLLTLADEAVATAESFGYADTRTSNDQSPLDRLAHHGRWLLESYGIRQFILLSRRDRMKEMYQVQTG